MTKHISIKKVIPHIWLIDDSRSFLLLVESILTDAGCFVTTFEHAEDALAQLEGKRPSLIISDIIMPGIDGLELLKSVKGVESDLPVILVSASANLDIACRAIRAGVFEIITKPLKSDELLELVDRAMVQNKVIAQRNACNERLEKKVLELTRQFNSTLIDVKAANLETIEVLSKIAEYRDDETAQHNGRIGICSYHLATELNMDFEFCEELVCAAPMHDIGKIAIPDSLLLKNTALSKSEFEIMKSHTTIGASMIECGKSSVLRMAREITLSHHEKWDGSGYPNSQKGDEIPLAARIVAIADHYDALRSWRPYKSPFTHDETLAIMTQGSGRTKPEHFDPEILSAFVKISDEMANIFDNSKNGCGKLVETLESIHE